MKNISEWISLCFILQKRAKVYIIADEIRSVKNIGIIDRCMEEPRFNIFTVLQY